MCTNFGGLSARSIFNERLISCVRTREKWPFHHFSTLVIDKCSKEERNKLSDHFNCILVVRIDSTTCDRNMKENYFGVQNRVERFKGDGLLIIVYSLRPFTCKDLLQYFGKCKQVFFLLLVIVMDSIKSNVSVYFVEGIQ